MRRVCVTLLHKPVYLIEASDQTFGLLGHSPLDAPLDHSLNVLFLVLFRHGDASPSWLQLPLCDLSWEDATYQKIKSHHRINSFRKRPPTCPKTSSLTVKVRSSMSSISLSFIHCRLWWNSSSRNSRSLRSHGLNQKGVKSQRQV